MLLLFLITIKTQYRLEELIPNKVIMRNPNLEMWMLMQLQPNLCKERRAMPLIKPKASEAATNLIIQIEVSNQEAIL